MSTMCEENEQGLALALIAAAGSYWQTLPGGLPPCSGQGVCPTDLPAPPAPTLTLESDGTTLRIEWPHVHAGVTGYRVDVAVKRTQGNLTRTAKDSYAYPEPTTHVGDVIVTRVSLMGLKATLGNDPPNVSFEYNVEASFRPECGEGNLLVASAKRTLDVSIALNNPNPPAQGCRVPQLTMGPSEGLYNQSKLTLNNTSVGETDQNGNTWRSYDIEYRTRGVGSVIRRVRYATKDALYAESGFYLKGLHTTPTAKYEARISAGGCEQFTGWYRFEPTHAGALCNAGAPCTSAVNKRFSPTMHAGGREQCTAQPYITTLTNSSASFAWSDPFNGATDKLTAVRYGKLPGGLNLNNWNPNSSDITWFGTILAPGATSVTLSNLDAGAHYLVYFGYNCAPNQTVSIAQMYAVANTNAIPSLPENPTILYVRIPNTSEPANPTLSQVGAQLQQWITNCNAPCLANALNQAIAATLPAPEDGVGQKFQTELSNLFAPIDVNLNHEAAGIFLTIGKDGRRFALKENHLYGSSRLGVDNRDTALYDNTKSGISRVWNPFYPQGSDGGWFDTQYGSEEPPFIAQIGEISSFTRGLKAYEISNHLGNVLVTFSDKKFGFGASGGDGILIMSSTDENSYFQPEILSAQDYYAYGATKPGRRGSLKKNANGEIAFVFDEAADANNWRPLFNYRFGYNTQEQTPEVTGSQHNTAEFWEYNPSGIIRWNLDPVTTPDVSPYAINRNNPIIFSDPNGDVAGDYYNPKGQKLGSNGKDDGRHYAVIRKELAPYTLGEHLVAAGAAIELPPKYTPDKMKDAHNLTIINNNNREYDGFSARLNLSEDDVKKFITEGKPLEGAALSEPGPIIENGKDGTIDLFNINPEVKVNYRFPATDVFHTHPDIPDWSTDVHGKAVKKNKHMTVQDIRSEDYNPKYNNGYIQVLSPADLALTKKTTLVTGNHYVISIRDAKVYIYGGTTVLYKPNSLDLLEKSVNIYSFPLRSNGENHRLFDLK